MDKDNNKIESIAQHHSAHDVGKENARNITQCNDTELEDSGLCKLGQQNGKRLRFEVNTKLKQMSMKMSPTFQKALDLDKCILIDLEKLGLFSIQVTYAIVR